MLTRRSLRRAMVAGERAFAPATPRALLLALLLTLINGCAGGGGVPTRFYVIDPIEAGPVNAGAKATGNEPLAVEILGLSLPQYLERFQIATRAGTDRLQFSEFHQWGENLRKNLIRTLARNLSRLLNTTDVGTPLARTAASPTHRVQLTIEQFERDTDGMIRLAASWQVIYLDSDRQQSEEGQVRSFHSEILSARSVAKNDYDAIVAEMRLAFGRLSQEIADAIEQAGQGG